MEYFVSVLVVAAFGYFIYTRVKASRNKPKGGSGGGGGGSNPNVHHK